MKIPLIVSAVIVLFFGLKVQAPADQAGLLEAKFRAEVGAVAQNLNGVLGLAVKDLKTGSTVFLNEAEVFPQASSIKISILLEVYKQVEEKKIRLEDVIALKDEDKVGGGPILQYLGCQPISLSLRDLCVLMIVLSDNTATNLLIDRVGMDNVNKRLEFLGLKKTRLQRKMMDLKAAGEGRENLSTPLEMMTLLEKIWTGQALGGPLRKDLLAILSIPKNSPLRAGVPEEVEAADKPGELEAVRCDSGIVIIPERPYILCVMTTFLKKDDEGDSAIEAISKLAYDYFDRLARSSPHGRIISEK